ncbi:MAG: hydrolase, partial [Pseudonocardiales bacterium]|nr:hydrolase [Pseudonocardiales bacterium]
MSSDGQVVSLAGPGGSLAATHWPPATGVTDRGPLLLLHGGGQTRKSWGQAGPRLAEIGFDVWSVDARGHGESDWSTDGSYGSTEFVRDLIAVVE